MPDSEREIRQEAERRVQARRDAVHREHVPCEPPDPAEEHREAVEQEVAQVRHEREQEG